jgi:hypothetical protein
MKYLWFQQYCLKKRCAILVHGSVGIVDKLSFSFLCTYCYLETGYSKKSEVEKKP